MQFGNWEWSHGKGEENIPCKEKFGFVLSSLHKLPVSSRLSFFYISTIKNENQAISANWEQETTT